MKQAILNASRIVSLLLVVILVAAVFSACSDNEGKASKPTMEERLNGTWKYSQLGDDIYWLLEINGKNVTYKCYLVGSQYGWTGEYVLQGDIMIVSLSDGSKNPFRIQENGNSFKLIDKDGHEYTKLP